MNDSFYSVVTVKERVIIPREYGSPCVVPNMSLSIKDIYDRFVRQQPIPGISLDAAYSSDVSFDNLSKLDKAELAKQYSRRVSVLRDQYQAQLKAEQAAAQQALVDKAVADALSAKTDNGSISNSDSGTK